MTRQQKKIIKNIEEIKRYIETDEALGSGFSPADFYEPFEDEVLALQEQLSYLSYCKEEVAQKRSSMIRGWCTRILLFLYDAFVVNFAYFAAIIIRFSDADSYNYLGKIYMQMFKDFAPWYMAISLLFFIVFRLYNGVWRYAGVNDIKKLMLINSITCVIYICGSLFVVGRMPITVYIVGAGIQFVMMSIPRLMPRFVIDGFMKVRGESRDDFDIPLMIVGIGENARIIQSKISKDGTGIIHPVCIIDYTYNYEGKSFNGLPVYCGPYAVYECIKKYGIRRVIIADKNIPKELLKSIRKICNRKKIELRDFVIESESQLNKITLGEVLKAAEGPICVVTHYGDEKRFDNVKEALMAFKGNLPVENISVNGDALLIRLSCDKSEEDRLDLLEVR